LIQTYQIVCGDREVSRIGCVYEKYRNGSDPDKLSEGERILGNSHSTTQKMGKP